MKKDEFVTDDQCRELYLVGRRLFKARKAMKLTQKKVAEQMEISDTSVSNHENGLKITIPVLNKYAKLYKEPVEYFFIEATDADSLLQEQIDDREVLRRVLPTLCSWRRKKSFRYFKYVFADDRELARWKKFAEKGAIDNGIESSPFAQYQRIAAEFGITLYELLFNK